MGKSQRFGISTDLGNSQRFGISTDLGNSQRFGKISIEWEILNDLESQLIWKNSQRFGISTIWKILNDLEKFLIE